MGHQLSNTATGSEEDSTSPQTNSFPVTHSILSPQALRSEVESDYDVGTPLVCQLISRGLNDTYLLKTADNRYILRVYRLGWRSLSDILYELDLLVHLDWKGVPVSTPLSRKDGSLTRALLAPEGIRQMVLFTHAKGKPISWDEAHSYLHGHAVGEIHKAANDFVSPHPRFPLDLEHLLERPLKSIQPFLKHRLEDWEYLRRLADQLRERITQLAADGLAWGVCHGDLYPDNAYIAEDDTVTIFDFDCGGPSWWSYDLAVFRHEGKLAKKDDSIWAAFFKGYIERRDVNELDLKAIPVFVTARHVWLMGMRTSNAEHFGYGWIDEGYWDRLMKFLREWVVEHLDGK